MISKNILNHIAIIMDGNRRWAKQNNKSKKEGHKEGAKKLLEVVDWILEYKIKYFTVYAFSTENWKRDITEINDIMNLLKEFLSKNYDEFNKKGIRLKVIGIEKNVEKSIISKIKEIEEITKNNKKMQLNIAFNYGGRQEIIDVTKKILEEIKNNNKKIENVDENLFKKHLYYGNIPDPDVILRTGGEFRISNFLLWESAYSEFFFTDELWPNFSKNSLVTIVNDFKQKRERKYGGN